MCTSNADELQLLNLNSFGPFWGLMLTISIPSHPIYICTAKTASPSCDSPPQNVVEARFQLNIVLVYVVIEVFSPQNLGYSHQLEDNKQGTVGQFCPRALNSSRLKPLLILDKSVTVNPVLSSFSQDLWLEVPVYTCHYCLKTTLTTSSMEEKKS